MSEEQNTADERDEKRFPILLSPAIDAWAKVHVQAHFTTHGRAIDDYAYMGAPTQCLQRHDWAALIIMMSVTAYMWCFAYFLLGSALAWMFNVNGIKAAMAIYLLTALTRSTSKVEPHSDWTSYGLKAAIAYAICLCWVLRLSALIYLVVF